MGRFLFIVILLAAAGFVAVQNGVELPFLEGGGDVAPIPGGVTRDTGQLEIQFDSGRPFNDSYMVFGGSREGKNGFSDVTLSVLDMQDASAIYQQYPDFHLCKSPGADRAKDRIRMTNLVAAKPSIASELGSVVDLHMKRLRSGAERTCFSMQGVELRLTSVKVKQNGADISGDVIPKFSHANFHYVQKAKIADCEPLLRGTTH